MCSSITTIIIIIYYRPTTTATTITSPGPSTSTKGKGGVWVGACTPRSTKWKRGVNEMGKYEKDRCEAKSDT